MALIEIIDNIFEDLYKGKYIAVINISLRKAFDTVYHQIPFDKLENYGFRVHILKWLTSYLHNRQQCTVVNGKNSSLKCINYGVPQGSVLGPLLFLIYTNGLKILLLYYLFRLVVKTYIPIDIQKHKMTTNNKKRQYKLHNIDAVKTNQLTIT